MIAVAFCLAQGGLCQQAAHHRSRTRASRCVALTCHVHDYSILSSSEPSLKYRSVDAEGDCRQLCVVHTAAMADVCGAGDGFKDAVRPEAAEARPRSGYVRPGKRCRTFVAGWP
jgi:hypothetical protein